MDAVDLSDVKCTTEPRYGMQARKVSTGTSAHRLLIISQNKKMNVLIMSTMGIVRLPTDISAERTPKLPVNKALTAINSPNRLINAAKKRMIRRVTS